MRFSLSLLIGAGLFLIGITAQAFCGFYVARASTDLFNQASQVVLVRDGDRTVLTMANDFQGETDEFAVVIPVPTFIERGQINVAEPALIEHLDAYTAPRLVEYFDSDPCQQHYLRRERMDLESITSALPQAAADDARKQGVRIEASYTVGEYDILILSADESDGLVRWLKQNDYQLPKGAERVIGSYLKQDMRFFVARVNLGEHEKLGYSYLRPLQVAFESPKFMLPIRLGTLNANGMQDLYVYALTRTGRVETANYRTVRMPSDVNVPEFVEGEFAEFYRAMFDESVSREKHKAVMLEYAWDMNWCDPCAADPMSNEELRALGVFWVDANNSQQFRRPAPQAANVFVTRLHLRYDGNTFPDDLRFTETGDRSNFQGRYVIQKAWTGDTNCQAGEAYLESLTKRRHEEARQLAALTGWELAEIEAKIPGSDSTTPAKDPWWKRLWNRG